MNTRMCSSTVRKECQRARNAKEGAGGQNAVKQAGADPGCQCTFFFFAQSLVVVLSESGEQS